MWHREPSVRCPVAQCGHGHCQQCGQAGHTSHPWSGLTQHPHFWKGSTIHGKNRECFQPGHQEFWIPTGSIQNECSLITTCSRANFRSKHFITFITFPLTLELASLRKMPPEINVARLYCNARWTRRWVSEDLPTKAEAQQNGNTFYIIYICWALLLNLCCLWFSTNQERIIKRGSAPEAGMKNFFCESIK